MIPLGMAERCIPFWVTLTLTLTSGLISRFFLSGAYLLYYSLLSSNVSYARPIPLGGIRHVFVTFLVWSSTYFTEVQWFILKKIVIFQDSRGGLSFFPRGPGQGRIGFNECVGLMVGGSGGMLPQKNFRS